MPTAMLGLFSVPYFTQYNMLCEGLWPCVHELLMWMFKS